MGYKRTIKRNLFRNKTFTTKKKIYTSKNNKNFLYEIICKKPKNKNQYIIQKTQKLIDEVKKSNLLAAS